MALDLTTFPSFDLKLLPSGCLEDAIGGAMPLAQALGKVSTPAEPTTSGQDPLYDGDALYNVPCTSYLERSELLAEEGLQPQPADFSERLSSSLQHFGNCNFLPSETQHDQPPCANGGYNLYRSTGQPEQPAKAALAAHNQGDNLKDAGARNKVHKKVGRPLAYTGDPNAPNLTEAEKRRIRRRIANRESARRVRTRQQQTLEQLEARRDQTNVHNAHLLRYIAELSAHSVLLKEQLRTYEASVKDAVASNAPLQRQLSVLQNQQQDHQATQACSTDEILCKQEA